MSNPVPQARECFCISYKYKHPPANLLLLQTQRTLCINHHKGLHRELLPSLSLILPLGIHVPEESNSVPVPSASLLVLRSPT